MTEFSTILRDRLLCRGADVSKFAVEILFENWIEPTQYTEISGDYATEQQELDPPSFSARAGVSGTKRAGPPHRSRPVRTSIASPLLNSSAEPFGPPVLSAPHDDSTNARRTRSRREDTTRVGESSSGKRSHPS